MAETYTETPFCWGNEIVRLHFCDGPDTPPLLIAIAPAGEDPDLASLRRSALPVVELAVTGTGRHGTAGKRHVDGYASARLRLIGRETSRRNDVSRMRLDLEDADGLTVAVHYEIADGSPIVRTWAMASARRRVVLDYISSFVLSGLGHGVEWEEQLALSTAANPWSGEFRWHSATLADRGLYDVGMTDYEQVGSKNRISMTSTGAWSTSEHLPMGVLAQRGSAHHLVWQIEHNGSWHYELGDRYGDVYLALSGPTAAEHQWAVTLEGGSSFKTQPVSVGLVTGGWDGIGAALTSYRRRRRRPHPDHDSLPIVFNDFLNSLMADPTTERELPLIEAAGDLGAEVFCIDAGWYDDEDDGTWWDSVGAWTPSVRRFPDGGLVGLTDRIRATGMKVGLWLEPEVVGVRSPLAAVLPDDAFFHRHGTRVTEWGRHQLDLRHPAARAHLDATVDRLMTELGLDYLKLDYNIDIGPGTDALGGQAAGAGLLEHNRAFLDWVAGLMDRYPGLTVEGCAAGGSRTDAASGAVFPLQSLTDQQDFLKMPPIVGAAATAIAPEQSGIWASVAGPMSDEALAYSLTCSLLGRVHLAGRIDTLTSEQRTIVRDGLDVYRRLRASIPHSSPVWPLGLPGWRDEVVAYGLRVGERLHLAVWRRGGPTEVSVPLPAWLGELPQAEITFPSWGEAPLVESCGTRAGRLSLAMPAEPAARFVTLEAGAPPRQ